MMETYLKSDKGYALLISLVAVIIFAILGFSLITLIANGSTRNMSRQNIILAQDLSEKGIEYAVKDIQNIIEKEIIARPMGKTDFSAFLDKTVNDLALRCPTGGIEIPSENGDKTKVCIEAVNMIKNQSGQTDEKDLYKRVVTFKSTGIVSGKDHITKADVIIGTDAIPDQLKYAVSSNRDGSLYFHGGVEVTGDIKTTGDVHIVKNAFSNFANKANWHTGVPLKLKPTIGSASAKIILSDNKKGVYYYNGSLSNNDKGIVYKNASSTFNIGNQNGIRNILTDTEKINVVAKQLPEDTMDVNKKVKNIYNDSNKAGIVKIIGETINGSNANLYRKSDSVSVLYYEYCYKSNKGICTDWRPYEKTTLKISKKNVNIQGTYYINGDLKIESSIIKSNAILYVDGDVTIRYSTLKELNNKSSLIIFASGDVFIANISENKDEPSEVKGFFYTEQDMTLYGVGSNIKIIGGVAAKDLYLTALRGSVSSGNYNISEKIQKTSKSRLQIIYDENIIKQFTDFQRDEKEEFITEINEPEMIKRQ